MNVNRGWKSVTSAALAGVALTAGLAGCGGGGSGKAAADPLAKADPQVQTLYKNTCLSCHGANLEGRVGPTTNLQHIGGRLTQEQIAKQIADGGGNMPGFGAKLKPDEVAALAAWLAGLK